MGALARLRVSAADARLPLANLKPYFSVRTPREYFRECFEWLTLYLAAFWVTHLVWRRRRFAGDPAILPALHLLTGIGLILAVSLRDPLRDTLEFTKFAWGCGLGCCFCCCRCCVCSATSFSPSGSTRRCWLQLRARSRCC